MKSLVLYATRHGNTRRAAGAIADGLMKQGTADVRSVDEGPAIITDDFDLVVIGGPTEGHHMTPQMREFLERIPQPTLAGRAAAAFDTRLDWPRWLSGSAAEDIRHELERMGAAVPMPIESFIVSMKPDIGTDELERAREWGVSLGGRVASRLITTSVGPMSARSQEV